MIKFIKMPGRGIEIVVRFRLGHVSPATQREDSNCYWLASRWGRRGAKSKPRFVIRIETLSRDHTRLSKNLEG